MTMQGTEGRSVKPQQSESTDGGSVGRGGRKQLQKRGETVHHQENLDVLKGHTFREMVAEKKMGISSGQDGDSRGWIGECWFTHCLGSRD